VDNGAILELNGDRLVGAFHQESDELHGGGGELECAWVRVGAADEKRLEVRNLDFWWVKYSKQTFSVKSNLVCSSNMLFICVENLFSDVSNRSSPIEVWRRLNEIAKNNPNISIVA
jgi:hypothetical protein